MNKINKAIGHDITQKMLEKNIKDYHLHSHLKVCTSPILTRIKRGQNKTSTNFPMIIDIYRAIGENQINIETEKIKINISL